MNGEYQPTDKHLEQLKRAHQFIDEFRRLQQHPPKELLELRPSFQNYLAYVRTHPSKEIQRKCRKLLKRRGRQQIADNNDILVSPRDSPAWMHNEMYIRLRCLQLVEHHDDWDGGSMDLKDQGKRSYTVRGGCWWKISTLWVLPNSLVSISHQNAS
jgi:hypothetical protein